MLNEQSVNVDLDDKTANDSPQLGNINNQEQAKDNQIDTLEDLDTSRQDGAFIAKKSSPPMIQSNLGRLNQTPIMNDALSQGHNFGIAPESGGAAVVNSSSMLADNQQNINGTAFSNIKNSQDRKGLFTTRQAENSMKQAVSVS